MEVLNQIFMRPARGTYREFRGIKAYPQPKDLSLYRQLLPAPFEMPDVPAILVFVADYLKVLSPFMRSYREAAVLLWSNYRGAPAWYILSMPLTTRFGTWMGRAVGFPKFVEKDIRLTNDDHCWRGQVKRAGQQWLSLEFRPGSTGPLSAWEKEMLEAETFFHGDIYAFVPPGQGPQINRIGLIYPIAPALPPVLGTACTAVGLGLPWAALADWDAPAPAAYCHFVGGMSIVVQQGI